MMIFRPRLIKQDLFPTKSGGERYVVLMFLGFFLPVFYLLYLPMNSINKLFFY